MGMAPTAHGVSPVGHALCASPVVGPAVRQMGCGALHTPAAAPECPLGGNNYNAGLCAAAAVWTELQGVAVHRGIASWSRCPRAGAQVVRQCHTQGPGAVPTRHTAKRPFAALPRRKSVRVAACCSWQAVSVLLLVMVRARCSGPPAGGEHHCMFACMYSVPHPGWVL